MAAAFRDSSEIRKFRHKNHSDHIDTDFPDCIIQPVYQKKKVESAQFTPGEKHRQHTSHFEANIVLTYNILLHILTLQK